MTGEKNPDAPSTSQPWVRLAGEDRDGSIERFELLTARRALKLLKSTLGRIRLLELLHDEIAAGDALLRGHVERSAGQETTGTTTLRAHGITAAQFTGWLSRAFSREDVLLAGHPEHYAIHPEAGGNVRIVETLGDQVCSFLMREWDDSITSEHEPPAPGPVPEGRRSRLSLDDGTVVGVITNSFTEEPDGFTARLSVSLPTTCGSAVVEQHLEHFAVEFRNWILTAAAEQATTTHGG